MIDKCPKCGTEILESPTLGRFHVCANPLDIRPSNPLNDPKSERVGRLLVGEADTNVVPEAYAWELWAQIGRLRAELQSIWERWPNTDAGMEARDALHGYTAVETGALPATKFTGMRDQLSCTMCGHSPWAHACPPTNNGPLGERRPADKTICCPRCGGELKDGKAMMTTYVAGAPDFQDLEGVTMSPGGPGQMVDVLKCGKCGYSRTPSKASGV